MTGAAPTAEYVRRNIRTLAEIGGLYDVLALTVAARHRSILGFPLDTPSNLIVESVIGRPFGHTNNEGTNHAKTEEQDRPVHAPPADDGRGRGDDRG